MYVVKFTKQAAKDARKLKASGLDKKAKTLVELVRKDPFAKPPAYEALVGNYAGIFSRRIYLQHRFVYEVLKTPVVEDGIEYEGTVKVLRMWTHYDGLR